MNTKPLVPNLQSIFLEIQELRKSQDVLARDFEHAQETLSKDVAALVKKQEKVDIVLFTGNGEVSLQESFRTLNTKLDGFMADVIAERKKRERLEEEERKSAEDWRSRWFWEVVKVVLPVVILLIANAITK